ncbi:MAG: GYF domain-containing protein [Bdellovibrionia bacterium]
MSQSQFFVSHDGATMGPHTTDEIVKKLEANELEWTDYLFEDEANDWVMLMEAKAINSNLKPSKKPEAAPKAKEKAEGTGNDTDAEDWFILKGDDQSGPFSFHDLVKMLQDKTLFEFDYIWRPGQDSWKRVAEVSSFSPDGIKEMKTSKMSGISNIFFRRRFKRREFGGTLIVHDNKKVWHGKSLEISEGGAGLIMFNAMVLPGQTLYLHFRPSGNVPPFNALVEVVSKKYVKGVQDFNAPMSYGVRFIKIQDEARQYLHDFTKAGKEAA